MILLTALLFLAHEGGWYPQECCHDQDCHPVPCVEIAPDNTWHGMKFPSIRPSPDGQCHVCVYTLAHRPLCLFIPEPTT
jgi:hypothetical protein